MILYVVYANKKLVQKTFKEFEDTTILTWQELLSVQNNKASKKRERITDEVFSLRFDTCLNSIKGKPGLKQCVFIISEDDIESIVSEKFNLLEINPW